MMRPTVRTFLVRFGRFKLRWLVLGLATLVLGAYSAAYIRAKHKLDLAISECERLDCGWKKAGEGKLMVGLT